MDCLLLLKILARTLLDRKDRVLKVSFETELYKRESLARLENIQITLTIQFEYAFTDSII